MASFGHMRDDKDDKGEHTDRAETRELGPLEKALLLDGATGRFVSEGWVDESEIDEHNTDADWMASMADQEKTRTWADKFFAIDDVLLGRYVADGWVDENEPIPPKNDRDSR